MKKLLLSLGIGLMLLMATPIAQAQTETELREQYKTLLIQLISLLQEQVRLLLAQQNQVITPTEPIIMPPITPTPTTPSVPANQEPITVAPKPTKWECILYGKSNGDKPELHQYSNVKARLRFDEQSKLDEWKSEADRLIKIGKKNWWNTGYDCYTI